MITKLRPLILVGPSGVGKSTLTDHLIEFYSNIFQFSISSTTRKRRGQEVDGVHYNFMSVEDFEKACDQNKFLEHNFVHGNYYGTMID